MSHGKTPAESIEVARQHHRAGRLRESELAYRQVLARQPDDPDALYGLGLLADHAGRPDMAADLLRRAIAKNPGVSRYHNDLGKALIKLRHSEQAHECFQKAVDLDPQFAEAHSNLGNTLQGQKKFDLAIATFHRAIELNPDYPEAYYNLGNALRDHERPLEAIAAYQRAIQLRPDLFEAYNNLGNALSALDRHDEAVATFQKLIDQKPNYVSAHNNLGGALQKIGKLDQALKAIDRAIQIKPDYASAHNNRGLVLKELGQLDEAMNSFRRAIHFKPDLADALSNLAVALGGQGRFHEWADLCRWVISRNPAHAEAYNSLAGALLQLGRIDEAAEACRKSLAINPDLAETQNNQANIYRDQGRLDEAIACYRRALELKPTSATIHGNLVYTIHFHADYDSQKLLAENREWAKRNEEPIAAISHDRPMNFSLDRRLRIGYVSPDFRSHCASCFLKPLIAHHDPAQVEVFCYSGVTQSDSITAEFKQLAHVWRDIASMPDRRLVETIRDDKIDILVDVALHMAGGRLLTFAHKPAPVQVSWLGYPSTTGSSRIDYRLTDPHLDPPGEGDEFYTEQSIRLPRSFWCYQPLVNTDDVSELPAIKNKHVTFGCFNNFVKVTFQTIELWSEVLQAVPRSKLLILCLPGSHRDQFREKFKLKGIDGDRIDFVGRASMSDYFRFYHRVDLCLDTFPYPGHTTALDGIWMGVPAVTLPGPTAAGRGGVSILSNLALPELIARTGEEFVAINRQLATDLPALAELRAGLRKRLQDSCLMNAKQFAADMEQAYRQMWKTWCEH
jgi:protein O-GlcNAc transferase